MFIFLKGEFAVPPGTHASDVKYYFPESFVFSLTRFFTHLFTSLFFGGGCRANINITTFSKSFSESFLNFVLTLNATAKWDTDPSSDVTPGDWEMWDGVNEMLFNVTEDGEPDIRLVRTESGLLDRCE